MKIIKAIISGYEVTDIEGNQYQAPTGVRGMNVPVDVIDNLDGTKSIFMFGRMCSLEPKEIYSDD